MTRGTRVVRQLWSRGRLAATRAPIECVFIVIALAWGVAQVFIVPPLQVPDEGDHWFRAWAITDGQLTADSQGMITLPGVLAPTADLYTRLVAGEQALPLSLKGQTGFTGYEDLFNGAGPSGPVSVASRVARYGPIGYLPQAVGIGLGRLVGAPPLTSFYLARLGNLLASVALLFFAIRLAPFGKQLFLLLALLPTTMFELASVSCDALTISGAMFFISLVLWASHRGRLQGIDVAILLLSAALFLNLKPGYWAIVMLVLLISPAQVGGRARHAAFVAASVLTVAGVTLLVFWLTATVAPVDAPVAAAAGPNGQLQFILHQPLVFLGILWSNIQDRLILWTIGGIGALGWLRVTFSPAFYLSVVMAGLVLFIRTGEDVRLQLRRRALLAATGIAVFLTLAVALYAFIEPMGSGRIFFQGRYLVPVWLLLLLSVYGTPLVKRYRGLPLLAGVSIAMMAVNLATLVSTYST